MPVSDLITPPASDMASPPSDAVPSAEPSWGDIIGNTGGAGAGGEQDRDQTRAPVGMAGSDDA